MSSKGISRLQKEILSNIESTHVVSAEELCDKIANVDKSTIYRNIEKLEKEGFIDEVPKKGKGRLYEICEKHHHHLICTKCNKFAEFELSSAFEYMLAYIQNKVSKENDFSLTDHTFDIYGVCSNCKNI